MTAKTLYDKLWEEHLVRSDPDGTALIYIDRHLVHEVTSPQAFEGLKLAGRKVFRIGANLAVSDHNVPTTDRDRPIADPISRLQVDTLDANCDNFGIRQFKMNDRRQGIVHVIGPEQGATLPGMTVVCGDSHTSTHGAFAALAHGIGTSEVEHVLATQCLTAKKAKNLKVQVNGRLAAGVTAKDLVLAIIGRMGTAGGTGYTIEFAGEGISCLSMEGRMTVCNMAIEAGARAGLIGVDDTTIDYLKGRPLSPQSEDWDQAVAYWRGLHSDEGAHFDAVVEINSKVDQKSLSDGDLSSKPSRKDSGIDRKPWSSKFDLFTRPRTMHEEIVELPNAGTEDADEEERSLSRLRTATMSGTAYRKALAARVASPGSHTIFGKAKLYKKIAKCFRK